MKRIDVQELACAQRHAVIFQEFEALAVDEGFEFVNDHDPKPLYRQFQQRYADQFSWDYLEQGPEVWRLQIRRVSAGTAREFQADPGLSIQVNMGVGNVKMVDVREIIPRERHPLIFSTFDALAVDEGFELVNDHDPKPLYYQFLHERADQFTWDYLEQGPDVWRVAICRKVQSEVE